jgi:nucleolin
MDIDNKMAEQNRNVENSQELRVFVGNVPFQCTTEEFVECFNDTPGFVNASVVKRFNSDMSRGFGYITLDTTENLENLLSRETLEFKDRTLRLSRYNRDTRRTVQKNNLVFVRNIPEETNEEDVSTLFNNNYGNVVKCSINVDRKTGKQLGSCIVEFSDRDSCTKALSEKELDFNGSVLNVYRFRDNSKNNNQYNKNPATRAAYKAGFRAGRTLGYQEGVKTQE